jgi:hypothetical protein
MKRYHVDAFDPVIAALQLFGYFRPDTIVPAMRVSEANDP